MTLRLNQLITTVDLSVFISGLISDTQISTATDFTDLETSHGCLQPRLVAKWSNIVSPNRVVEDLSGNGYHAEIRGTVLATTHYGKSCLSFSLGENWLEILDFPPLPIGPGFNTTIAMDFCTTRSSPQALIDRGGQFAIGVPRDLAGMLTKDGQLYWGTSKLVRKFEYVAGLTKVTPLNDGKWHSVKWIFHGECAKMEIDGKIAAVWTTDWNLCQNAPLLIGARHRATRNSDYKELFFEGYLANIQIHSSSIPPNHIP